MYVLEPVCVVCVCVCVCVCIRARVCVYVSFLFNFDARSRICGLQALLYMAVLFHHH